MLFCPRFSELASIKMTPHATDNYVDFDKGEMVLQSFKNRGRSNRPARRIPLTPDIIAIFRNMRDDPLNYGNIPQNTADQLDRWLRPLFAAQLGYLAATKLMLTNNTLRSIAFNDAWRQINELPSYKAHDLLVFNENLVRFHDHQLSTAILSYTRMISEDTMVTLTKRLKECAESRDEQSFIKELVQGMNGQDVPSSPPYDHASAHFAVDTTIPMESSDEEEPQQPQKTKAPVDLAAQHDELFDYNPPTPLPPVLPPEGPSPSLPASPHLAGPLDAYAADADEPQPIKAKREARAKRKLPLGPDTDTDGEAALTPKAPQGRTALTGKPPHPRTIRAQRFVNQPGGGGFRVGNRFVKKG
jgi:hypothetical protein